MKMKVVALTFLIVFAAVAFSLVVGLSTIQTFEEKVGFHKSYSIVQIGDNDTAPQGDPIDCPEMPGHYE